MLNLELKKNGGVKRFYIKNVKILIIVTDTPPSNYFV